MYLRPLRVALFSLVLLAIACDDVPLDDTRAVVPSGVMRGTALYQGRPPCTASGHVVGNLVLLVFDQTNRKGAWGGALLRAGRHVDIALEARKSDGGVPGPANSYSLNIAAQRFTRANFGVRVRGTHFSNLQSNGDLYALSTGVTVVSGVELELAGGRLDESNVDPALDRNLTWYGLEMNAAIGRHWYLLLSLERDSGTFEEQDQVYAGVTYRF